MRSSLLFILLIAILLAGAASATTYVVNPQGTGDFPTIQAAVDATEDGDVIELEDGVYTGDGNRDVDYLGKAITIRSQSGDPATCIIDCQASSQDMHRGFSLTSEEGPESVLTGITVTNAYVWGDEPTRRGGGVRAYFSSPTITNCVFDNCSSEYGGGVCCFYGASPNISDCLFTRCDAWRGGGVYVHEYIATIFDCRFVDNESDKGGAIVTRNAIDMLISNCEFIDNRSTTYCGGTIYFNLNTTALVEDCVFIDSYSADYGGAVCCEEFSEPVLRNCTFYNCESAWGAAGILAASGSLPVLENTIIAGSPSGEAVRCESAYAELSCCDLYGNAGGDWVGCIAYQYGTNGNIAEDPLFCDPEDGNLFLQTISPCAPFSPPNPECDLIGALPVGCEPPPPPPPYAITAVTDVGNDQGRRIRLRWNRQPNDCPGADTTIAAYLIWRRIDEHDGGAAGRQQPHVVVEPGASYPPGDWDFVKEVPACFEEQYSTICETLCDSTATGGICWSVFFVRAEGSLGGATLFFDTAPDSGYSVDNLAPAVPTGLRYEEPTQLVWDASPEEDFNYFTVYGSEVDHLTPAATRLGYTTEPTFDITGHNYPFFHVTATDFAGNEGAEATVGAFSHAGPGPVARGALRLFQNRPNPARTDVTIGFELPAESRVDLKIFDLSGRVVTALVQGRLGAGPHQVSWNGYDQAGERVEPALYFYRLEACGKSVTRKLLLTR